MTAKTGSIGLQFIMYTFQVQVDMIVSIVTCTGGTRDGMTGSSSDDWILSALWLQPLLITLTYSAIAIPHTLHSSLH
jgi:hypothetical protein